MAVIAATFMVYVPSGTSSSIRPANEPVYGICYCKVVFLYCMFPVLNVYGKTGEPVAWLCRSPRTPNLRVAECLLSCALTSRAPKPPTFTCWNASTWTCRCRPHTSATSWETYVQSFHSPNRTAVVLRSHLSQLHIFGLTKLFFVVRSCVHKHENL